jgi:hypothetical protein
VIMRLSEKYPYREMYEQSFPWKNAHNRVSPRYLYLSWA